MTKNHTTVPPRKRFLAATIDGFICLILLVFQAQFSGEWFETMISQATFHPINVLILSVLYLSAPFLVYFSLLPLTSLQGSIGKYILGLRVVSTPNRHKLSILQALFRSFCSVVSYLIVIGPFFVLFDNKNRALHDILSKTRVVYHS